MIKKILFILLLITTNHVSAEKILKADFEQFKYLEGMPKPLQSKGELLLWEDKGILWFTKKPIENKLIINKQGIYQITEDDTLKPLIKNKLNDILDLFFNLLNNDLENINQSFILNTINNNTIELRPKSRQAKSRINSIKINFSNKKKKLIQKITINFVNKERDVLVFNKHQIFNNSKIIKKEQRNYFND